VGQWLAGLLSVLSLLSPARASILDASRYFSDAKTRMKPTRQVQGVVYEVGVLLKIPELRPDCVADMERFR
jgi:hypothetical protein